MQTIPFHSLYVNCKEDQSTDYLEYKKMFEDHLAYSAGQVKKVDPNFYEVGAVPIAPHKYITFCIENKNLHLAIYDAATNEFSRNIEFSDLQKVKRSTLKKLDVRIQNTIEGALRVNDLNIDQYWKKEVTEIKEENKQNEKYHLSSFDDRIREAMNHVNHNRIDPNIQEQREKSLSRQSTNPNR